MSSPPRPLSLLGGGRVLVPARAAPVGTAGLQPAAALPQLLPGPRRPESHQPHLLSLRPLHRRYSSPQEVSPLLLRNITYRVADLQSCYLTISSIYPDFGGVHFFIFFRSLKGRYLGTGTVQRQLTGVEIPTYQF